MQNLMNTSTSQWGIAAVGIVVAFLVGASGGAYIGEVLLVIADPIAGCFLSTFLVCSTAYLLAPNYAKRFASITYLINILWLYYLFLPLDSSEISYLYSAVFGGALALILCFSVDAKFKISVVGKNE